MNPHYQSNLILNLSNLLTQTFFPIIESLTNKILMQ